MTAAGMGRTILIAEADPADAAATRQFLERHAYRVFDVADGPTAVQEASLGHYDLVLLDPALPGPTGDDVLVRLRRQAAVPVIVVAGRDEEAERVRWLDLGADDYLTQPVSLPELEARIRAVLRRGQPYPYADVLDWGDLIIDRNTHRVVRDGDAVDLTRREFDLLAFLAGSPDQVFTREELLEHVWGSTGDWQDAATVTEHIRRIRLKLEPDPGRPRWLHTVRGVGYRFSRPDAADSS